MDYQKTKMARANQMGTFGGPAANYFMPDATQRTDEWGQGETFQGPGEYLMPTSGFVGGFSPDAPGMSWVPGQSGWEGAPGSAQGYWSGQAVGMPGYMQDYNPDGSPKNTPYNDSGAMKTFLTGLAMMGGVGAMNGAFAGLGAGAGEAGTTLGNGAFLGEGVSSGVPAWDAAMSGIGAATGGVGATINTLGGGGAPFDISSLNAAYPTMTAPSISPEMFTAMEGAGGGGLLNTLKNAGSSIGGLKNILPIAGALAGASSGGQTNTATSQSKTDPRLDPYLYGDNGILKAVQDQYLKNPGGINPTMQQGFDMSKAALTDPAYSQGYQQMRQMGQGLLNQGVAPNPFNNGQAGLLPNMQAGGGPMDMGNFRDRAKALIASGRGLV